MFDPSCKMNSSISKDHCPIVTIGRNLVLFTAMVICIKGSHPGIQNPSLRISSQRWLEENLKDITLTEIFLTVAKQKDH